MINKLKNEQLEPLTKIGGGGDKMIRESMLVSIYIRDNRRVIGPIRRLPRMYWRKSTILLGRVP